MPINRQVKKLTALVLGGATVAVVAQTSAHALTAQHGSGPVAAAVAGQGNPNAVPPLLPPLRPSELAELRRAEAQKQQEFYYRLPASARYSNAEMNVFAAEGYA